MKLHPLHPLLVHAPIACWAFTPVFDAIALVFNVSFFWQAGALMAAIGVLAGAVAATAGAIDLPHAQAKVSKLAVAHASLMSGAWLLATIGLIGRVGSGFQAILPPPWWAIAASSAALLIMIVGAWCGGEMVYGHAIGVRDQPPDAGLNGD